MGPGPAAWQVAPQISTWPARGLAGRSSDIDVAILPLDPLPPGTLSAIREALEESRVLYSVDVVDLSYADPAFRERVLKEGVLWNGSESD